MERNKLLSAILIALWASLASFSVLADDEVRAEVCFYDSKSLYGNRNKICSTERKYNSIAGAGTPRAAARAEARARIAEARIAEANAKAKLKLLKNKK